MRLFISGLALIPTTASAQAVAWARVTDQHHSSIELPVSVLTARADPTALVFDAGHGKVHIRFETVTESRPGFPGNDPKGDMDLKRADCTTWPPAYLVLKDTLAAYSCVKGSRIGYYLARYTPWGSATLYVDYPAVESPFWNTAIKRMASSIRQVERHEIHP